MIQVTGATLLGVEAHPVTVEVDLLRRLPQVVIVGLAAATVRESAERVRSAILASGIEFPRCRVVVSLAPADLRKEGPGLDLPIALGILGENRPAVYFGELSLSGDIRSARGILAVAELASRMGLPLVCAAEDAPFAARVCSEVYGATSLSEVVSWARGGDLPRSVPAQMVGAAPTLDFADIRGMSDETIGLVLDAARTRRPLLFVGPPGCSKTMLAARLPGLLPELTTAEGNELARIYDAAGFGAKSGGSRPFRAPHHTVSQAGLVGNAALRPGEATLAHRGVLFLDEITEFQRACLDTLEGVRHSGGVISLQRSTGSVRLPADFWLVAASNPCPCGFLGHSTRACACSEEMVARYQARWRHPLLADALLVKLSPLSGTAVLNGSPAPSTAELRRRIEVM